MNTFLKTLTIASLTLLLGTAHAGKPKITLTATESFCTKFSLSFIAYLDKYSGHLYQVIDEGSTNFEVKVIDAANRVAAIENNPGEQAVCVQFDMETAKTFWHVTCPKDVPIATTDKTTVSNPTADNTSSSNTVSNSAQTSSNTTTTSTTPDATKTDNSGSSNAKTTTPSTTSVPANTNTTLSTNNTVSENKSVTTTPTTTTPLALTSDASNKAVSTPATHASTPNITTSTAANSGAKVASATSTSSNSPFATSTAFNSSAPDIKPTLSDNKKSTGGFNSGTISTPLFTTPITTSTSTPDVSNKTVLTTATNASTPNITTSTAANPGAKVASTTSAINLTPGKFSLPVEIKASEPVKIQSNDLSLTGNKKTSGGFGEKELQTSTFKPTTTIPDLTTPSTSTKVDSNAVKSIPVVKSTSSNDTIPLVGSSTKKYTKGVLETPTLKMNVAAADTSAKIKAQTSFVPSNIKVTSEVKADAPTTVTSHDNEDANRTLIFTIQEGKITDVQLGTGWEKGNAKAQADNNGCAVTTTSYMGAKSTSRISTSSDFLIFYVAK